MKPTATTSVIVIVLSTITWAGFYFTFPDAPLGGPETALMVAVYYALVVGVGKLFNRNPPP